jgi:broad specificity phosphatase PhoE
VASFAEVLIVRHGRTEWNEVGRRQGQLDSPLTAEGVRDAHRAAALVRAAEPDAIFTSPQGRAMTTAHIVVDGTGLVARSVPELAEVHHGSFAGLTNDEIEGLHPGELARRAADKYQWRFPGGESYADADLRAGRALDAVAASGATRPVLVTHEMLARMVLRRVLDLDLRTALAWRLRHGTVLRVRSSDGTIERLSAPEPQV